MVKTPDGVLGRPDACWGPADAVGDPAGPHSVRFHRFPYKSLAFLPSTHALADTSTTVPFFFRSIFLLFCFSNFL